MMSHTRSLLGAILIIGAVAACEGGSRQASDASRAAEVLGAGTLNADEAVVDPFIVSVGDVEAWDIDPAELPPTPTTAT